MFLLRLSKMILCENVWQYIAMECQTWEEDGMKGAQESTPASASSFQQHCTIQHGLVAFLN